MLLRAFPFLLLMSMILSCQQKEAPYNVVVLFTDDQRFNTIRALGNSVIQTPNMDRLVEMGVSFTRAHIQGSHHGGVCAPSRAMLLSGKPYMNIPRAYIDQGQASHDTHFPFTTFPELLKENGYTTFFTGKWHNNTSKIREGFSDGANIFIGGMHWPKNGGHRRPQLWDFDPTGRYATENKWQGESFSSELYSDAAVNFIKKQNGQNPFCLYVAYTSPHDPREAPEAFRQLYDTATLALPPNYLPAHPFNNGHLRTRDENLAPFPRTPSIIKEELAAYYAMISEVDAQIGRVLDELEAKKLMDRTIIVFAGDNGLAVGQHGLLGKQSVYDHSVRVPLIIAAPGLAGKRQAKTLCYLYDVFPTLCDMLQLDIPKSVEGKSLFPALQNPNSTIRDQVFLAHAKEMRAIRNSDDWKLIHNFVKGQTQQQLFDLKKDPWETNNLAENANHADKKAALYKLLAQSIDQYGDQFLQPHIALKQSDFDQPVEVSISQSFPGAEVRYQLEGGKEQLYDQPFWVKHSASLSAQLYQDDQPIGQPIKAIVNIAKGVEKLDLVTPPSPKYAAKGKFSLLDGGNGTVDFHDGNWLGYDGEDFTAILQLKEGQPMSELGIRYLSHVGSWIFPPRALEVSISEDGKSFVPYFEVLIPELESAAAPEVVEVKKSGDKVTPKLVKVVVRNTGICPEWHAGKGGKAWLFIDEIFLN